MDNPRGEREGSPPQVPSFSSEAIMQHKGPILTLVTSQGHSLNKYHQHLASHTWNRGKYIHITGYSRQRDEQWPLVDGLLSKQIQRRWRGLVLGTETLKKGRLVPLDISGPSWSSGSSFWRLLVSCSTLMMISGMKKAFSAASISQEKWGWWEGQAPRVEVQEKSP